MQNSPNNGSRRAFLVSTRGDSTILLEETDSWTPVAWQGGTTFVLAAWDDALRDSFHFAFQTDSTGEWSLWTPDACRPSIKINGEPCSAQILDLRDGDIITAQPQDRPISLCLFQSTNGFLDVYEPGRLLGSGTFGSVHCCRLRDDAAVAGPNFAVKVIRRHRFLHEADPDASYNRCFQKECGILQRLKGHSNILEIWDTFSGWISSHIVTEYLEDHDLLTTLEIAHQQRVLLDMTQVRNYVRQICVAMEYIHQQGIVHRDLKLENVMLHGSVIKIIDFGVADYLPIDGRGLRGQIGTNLYMAPEVVADLPQYETVDCWSLGILIQALILGLPVVNTFQGNHLHARAEAAPVIRLLAALFSHQPNARPSMTDCLNDSWLRSAP